MHPSHNKVYLESLWTDRNIAMGISTNTYATATTIISRKELRAHFGPNYNFNSVPNPTQPILITIQEQIPV